MMTLGLNWGAVNNNGNLQSQTITRPGLSATTNYGYDGLNRLTSASEGANWSQTYVYDNVGNRAVASSSPSATIYTPQTTPTSSPPPGSSANWPYDPTTNRWAAPAAAYDAAGNVTGMRTQTVGYDAESRMTSWADTSGNVGSVTFTYDGDGRRVTKTSSLTGETTYVYDPAGNLAVEVGGQVAPAATSTYNRDTVQPGRLSSVATPAVTVSYGSYDALGRPLSSTQGVSGYSCAGRACTLGHSYDLTRGPKMYTVPSCRKQDADADTSKRPPPLPLRPEIQEMLRKPGVRCKFSGLIQSEVRRQPIACGQMRPPNRSTRPHNARDPVQSGPPDNRPARSVPG